MNKVILQGRLTSDVSLSYAANESGTAIGRFRLAVPRSRANSDGTRSSDFLSCVSFGKSAENISNHFHKGDGIIIIGRIETGSYTNKDGQKVYTTDIVVENWEFPLSNRRNTAENGTSAEPDASAAASMPAPDTGSADDYGVDEDIPFN